MVIAIASTETSSGITQEQYDKVRTGMTLSQVREIMGSNGQKVVELEILGTKAITYQWNGKELLSYAQVVFTNGKVSSKIASGLK